MSITYNQQGKITLEPTRGNILGITEIVLQHFEKTMIALEKKNPKAKPAELRRQARDLVEKNIEKIAEVIHDSCRKAMMSRPEDALRKDLIGRILFYKLEHLLTDDLEAEDGFPRQFIQPVLLTVREIIGETHYQNLNEHSIRPSLEYCVVHELGESKISWEDFYSQNLVSILLIRIKNVIKRWLTEEPGRSQAFIESVNSNIEDQHDFDDRDFQMLMHAWEVHEEKES